MGIVPFAILNQGAVASVVCRASWKGHKLSGMRKSRSAAADGEDNNFSPSPSPRGATQLKSPRAWGLAKTMPGGDMSDPPAEGDVMGKLASSILAIQAWTVTQEKLARQILEKQSRLETMLEGVSGSCAQTALARPQAESDTASRRSPPKPMIIVKEDAEDVDGKQDKRDCEKQPLVLFAEQPCGKQSEDDDMPRIGKVNSVTVEALWRQTQVHESHHDHRAWHCLFFEHVVEHWAFEYASAVVILGHSFFIGAYVQYMAVEDYEGSTAFSLINIFFVMAFTVEVVLKFGAERQEFFQGVEWKWNVFDTILLAMVFVEVPMGFALAGKGKKHKKKMKTVLKIAEMVRTARVLRIFRFLKFSRTLRIILSKVFTSVRALGWVMILLFIELYVVAVCLTQGSNDFLQGRQQESDVVLTRDEQRVKETVGNLWQSLYTLFASISGGILWGEAAEAVALMGWFYVSLYVLFIVSTVFALLNVMTGIFLDDTIRADSDLQTEHEDKQRLICAQKLRETFETLDMDGSGKLTRAEFVNFVEDSAVKTNLKELGIDPAEAVTLFYLIDEDSSGELDANEFLSGLMHLKGSASSVDMKVLLYETRHTRSKMLGFQKFASEQLAAVKNKLFTVDSRSLLSDSGAVSQGRTSSVMSNVSQGISTQATTPSTTIQASEEKFAEAPSVQTDSNPKKGGGFRKLRTKKNPQEMAKVDETQVSNGS